MDQSQFDQLIMRLDILNKLLAVLATKSNGGQPTSFRDVSKFFKTIGFDDEEIFGILSTHYGEKTAKRFLEKGQFGYK